MVESMQVMKKLIERYDYCGAYEVLKDKGMENMDSAVIINSCRYAVNFDFYTARKHLRRLSESAQKYPVCVDLMANLESLNDGQPDVLMSELLENLKFQIVNEEYIDFLGRVYRFKEAIYKFMFIKSQLPDRNFTFQMRFLQKKEILKILRNHYKIFNNNLIFALNSYFRKYDKNTAVVDPIIKLMNSEKMNQLIELRHNSLIGHGFKGVSAEEIQRVYGNPYNVLDDFRACLMSLGIEVQRYKYSIVNELILELLAQDYKTFFKINNSSNANFE
ncbi:hypothetical protein QE109_12160 [Fusibacter bizertensis]|jgi:hypothetical protein|uniref:Uncharacterized protein n=1 Tax=Fusibacter bizertensis TaxID=1488331 RepID=A0ABT6NEW5_9FIRM|nr:hypothetical protein [Fusibacter bizertensis]MDH8678910.1 hypothetical protein [Fusibacter bizertensis]